MRNTILGNVILSRDAPKEKYGIAMYMVICGDHVATQNTTKKDNQAEHDDPNKEIRNTNKLSYHPHDHPMDDILQLLLL